MCTVAFFEIHFHVSFWERIIFCGPIHFQLLMIFICLLIAAKLSICQVISHQD